MKQYSEFVFFIVFGWVSSYSLISDIYADTVSSDSEDKSVKAMADEIRLSVSQLKREFDQIEQENGSIKQDSEESEIRKDENMFSKNNQTVRIKIIT